MNKDELRIKIGVKGNRILLSAQDYNRLTSTEKSLLDDILLEDGDTDYISRIERLFPKAVTLKPLTWRKK